MIYRILRKFYVFQNPLKVYRLFPSQRLNPAAFSQKSYPLFCASRMLFTELVSSLLLKLSFRGDVSNLCTTLIALKHSSIFRMSGNDEFCQKNGITINPKQMPNK